MASEKRLIGLDIGSSKIRCASGSIDRDGQLMIDCLAERPSEGIKSGAIVNIEQTLRSIQAVVNDVELQAGGELDEVIIGIGGESVKGYPSEGVVGISTKEQEIKRQDVYKAIDQAKMIQLPVDTEVLHVLIQDFIIDGREGINDPVDMLGHRLESKVLLVAANQTLCQNHKKCIQRAGLSVKRTVLQTVADSEVVLSAEEKEVGTILINIGSGSSDMIVYSNGAPRFVGGINIGGDAVTNDISYILQKTKSLGEQIKCDSGHCYVPSVSKEEIVVIPQVGGMPAISIPKIELAKVIEARMAEIFSKLYQMLQDSGVVGNYGGGVVLVGGGALLSGATDLAQEIFRLPARLGFPKALSGLDRTFIDPRYTTVLGLIECEAKKYNEAPAQKSRSKDSKGGIASRIRKLFKSLV